MEYLIRGGRNVSCSFSREDFLVSFKYLRNVMPGKYTRFSQCLWISKLAARLYWGNQAVQSHVYYRLMLKSSSELQSPLPSSTKSETSTGSKWQFLPDFECPIQQNKEAEILLVCMACVKTIECSYV